MQPTRHARHLEHHLEVLRLRRTDHVHQQISPEPLDPIDDARQIARRVHERAAA
jgi:hypothetical protein